MEQTYIMIKPDGVQRGLVGAIIARFETKGFYLRGMKMMSVTKEHAEKHYADLSSKPFFGDLVDYMCSGPVVCMVWEGKEVVKTGRKIIGATNPLCVPLPSPPSIADAAAALFQRTHALNCSSRFVTSAVRGSVGRRSQLLTD